MANKKQDDMTLQAIVDRDVLGMLDNHDCKRITMTHFAMQLCVNAAAGLSDTHTARSIQCHRTSSMECSLTTMPLWLSALRVSIDKHVPMALWRSADAAVDHLAKNEGYVMLILGHVGQEALAS